MPKILIDQVYNYKARSEALTIKQILSVQGSQSFTPLFVLVTRSNMLFIARVTTYRPEVEAKGGLVFVVQGESDDYSLHPERGCSTGFDALKVFYSN